MAVKTFGSERLTSPDINTYLANSGLVYVTSSNLTTVTNTISNAFSSTYDSYRVVVSGLNNATTTLRQLQMRIGTEATNNYAYGHGYIYGNALNAISGSAAQNIISLGFLSQAAGQGLVFDIHNPFATTNTVLTYQMVTYQQDITAFVFRQGYASLNTATSYTSFQIIGQTDNLSGLVTVYGYRKA